LRNYEGLFILDPTMSEDKMKETVQGIEALIKQSKGGVEKIEEWGHKKLQYPIKGKKEAPFFLMYFAVPRDTLMELRKNLRLRESILRFSIFKKEEEKKGGKKNG